MFIKKLVLHNIQKHKDLSVDFSRNITSITGETDSGKSSIIRALNCVMFNKPSLSELRTTTTDENGKTEVSKESWIKIYIDKDGEEHCIGRYVSDSKNIYALDDKIFKSFGRSVPDPITKLLNLEQTINMQGQYDTPFLIGYSSGEVARLFNSMLDLDDVTNLSNNINKDIRDKSSEISVIDNSISNIEDELSSIESVTHLESDCEKIDSLFIKIDNSTQKRVSVDLNVNSLNKIDMNPIMCIKPIDFTDIEHNLNIYNKKKESCNKLNEYILLYKHCRTFEPPAPCNLDLCISNLGNLEKRVFSIKKIKDNLYKISEKAIEIDDKLVYINKELGDIDVCPTCGKPIEKENNQ